MGYMHYDQISKNYIIKWSIGQEHKFPPKEITQGVGKNEVVLMCFYAKSQWSLFKKTLLIWEINLQA